MNGSALQELRSFIKAKEEDAHAIRSFPSSESVPLQTLLSLIIRGESAFHNNYGEGIKAWHDLFPNLQFNSIPEFPIPRSLRTWEILRISESLGIAEHIIFAGLLEANYGSEIATAIVQRAINTARVPKKVPAPETDKQISTGF